MAFTQTFLCGTMFIALEKEERCCTQNIIFVLRASKFSVLKLKEIIILWVSDAIYFGFSPLQHLKLLLL